MNDEMKKTEAVKGNEIKEEALKEVSGGGGKWYIGAFPNCPTCHTSEHVAADFKEYMFRCRQCGKEFDV